MVPSLLCEMIADDWWVDAPTPCDDSHHHPGGRLDQQRRTHRRNLTPLATVWGKTKETHRLPPEFLNLLGETSMTFVVVRKCVYDKNSCCSLRLYYDSISMYPSQKTTYINLEATRFANCWDSSRRPSKSSLNRSATVTRAMLAARNWSIRRRM